MSDYKQCTKCGEWGWSSHRCKPTWFVRPDYYDEGEERTVYANDPEEAATKFLDERFSDFDYPKSMTVIVINPDHTEQHTVEIEVEAVPSFHASITESKSIAEAERIADEIPA
jgi:hypothetical protein